MTASAGLSSHRHSWEECFEALAPNTQLNCEIGIGV